MNYTKAVKDISLARNPSEVSSILESFNLDPALVRSARSRAHLRAARRFDDLTLVSAAMEQLTRLEELRK